MNYVLNGLSVFKNKTYVAPTVLSFKKCGVNWYRTNRPAFGSKSFTSVSGGLSLKSYEPRKKRKPNKN
jgi:hypothetical protein